jgi:uncharacterized protein (TIGR02099 family)
MIRLLKPLAAKLWLAFMLLIIICGIVVGSARVLLPKVSEYRAELEQLASEQLSRKVHIGALGASWHGLGPRLVLEDVTLEDPRTGEPALELARVELGLAWRDSLEARALRPGRVTLVGAELLVKRRSDGSIAIAGLEDLERDSAGAGAPRALRLPARLSLRDSVIEWENQAIGGRPMRFDQVEVTLVTQGERTQLNASLHPPGNAEGRIELAADVTGQPNQPRGWVADLYLGGDHLPLSRLLRDRLPATYAFDSGTSDLRTWSHWEGGRLSEVTGRVDLHQVRLTEPRGRALSLPNAGGRFRWERTPTGWRLDAANVRLQRLGRRWPESSFSLASELDSDGRIQVRFGADFLRIEDLLALAWMFPVPENRLTEAIGVAEPAGDVRALALSYSETKAAPRWSLRGEVVDLGIHPWDRLPGVSGLGARFRIDQIGGQLELEGEDMRVDLPRLFRWPLSVARLGGRLRWERSAAGWRIESPALRAENKDILTRSRLTLEIPSDPESSPWLDLQVDFRDGKGANAGRYYPVGIMPPKLVKWLDRAIVRGKVTSGSALVRGPLRDFPFHRTQNGRFEVLFGAEGVVLDYHPEWPRLEEVTAEVRFLNNSFEARVYQGHLFESQVIEAEARLESLRPISRLKVNGSVRSNLPDNLRLLRETALADKFRELTQGLSGRGPTRVAIDLSLPVSPKTKAPMELSGQVDFQQAGLTLADWDLDLQEIRGRLGFTESSISAQAIQARAFDSPVVLDVATVTEGRPFTRVSARARLDQDVLLARAPPARFARPRGSADWTLDLDIPHRWGGLHEPPRLTLRSDLTGLSLDLPPPVGKSADQPRELTVSLDLTNGEAFPLTLHYDELLDARMILAPTNGRDPHVLRGGIRLGGDPAELPAREGLMISGHLAQLDLAPWMHLDERRDKGTSGAVPIKLSGLDVQVGDLRYADALDLGLTALNFSPSAEAWSGTVDCRHFKGFLSIPHDLDISPITARLARLDLEVSQEDTDPAMDYASPSQMDPRGLPTLDLEATSLSLNGDNLGQLSLRTGRLPDGVKLSHMKLESEQLDVLASGAWTKAEGRAARSQLNFTLETDDLGGLLSVLGFDQTVEGRDAQLKATLQWPGSPLDMRQKALSGHLEMEVGEGRFLEVDPGVGRVFGLLSLGTLQRRLSLNFSDLVDKGLSFDRIRGSFLFEEGDAYTKDLMIRGPSARIDIAGRIGLVRKDFEQVVTVTPELSSSIPVAGALAGGPAVGAALLVAERLMGERVNRMGSSRYGVSGPWSDPRIEKLERNARREARAQTQPSGTAPSTRERAVTP